MRIVHLANFYGPRSGGLRTMMQALAREYSDRGVSITHIVPGARGESAVIDDVPTHFIASPVVPRTGGYRVIQNLRRVRELLEWLDPDVLEISDRLTLLRATNWARRNGVRTVMFAHERIDGVVRANAEWLPATTIADAMNRYALRSVDDVVATTHFAAAEFQRVGHDPHIVPLGFDSHIFRPGLREIAGVPAVERPLRIAMCSRLSYEKACHLPIAAVAAALDRGVPVHLDVIGDGPLRRELEQQASRLPVTFHGFVSERNTVASMLANADVVMAPGPIETFGLAALESLGCGTPVIANAASAVPEILGDAGGTAGTHPEQWLDEAVRLAEAGDEGRERALRRASGFSWNSTANTLLGLYSR